MTTTTYPAAKLPTIQRIELAIESMVSGTNVSRLAQKHKVSRKYIYVQKAKARLALEDAFTKSPTDDALVLSLPVTNAWLQQVVLSLTLICHSSYRGVQEFMRDMLGVSISLGGVHNLHQLAIRRARDINQAQDLSCIRVGLHDEIFHCNAPVLVGVDARSTYCYLLAAQEHRDAETWAIHHPSFVLAGQRIQPRISDR